MEDNYSPSYVNLTMGYLDLYILKYNLFSVNIACYNRYIDDIVSSWEGDTHTVL